MEGLCYQTATILNHKGIVHGFFGRQGGVSQGIYASLNTCFDKGDDVVSVIENRRRICAGMGLSQMITLRQVHQDGILVVNAYTAIDQYHQMDAMVSKTQGLLLGIQTADCLPILLADPANGVIGAVHAGWRGAIAGIVTATIMTMQTLGANNKQICAAIGPCVHQKSYEVGPNIFAAVHAHKYFTPSNRPKHYLFNLAHYVLDLLYAAGIPYIMLLPFDTYELEDQYFSYRRSAHRGSPVCGRQLSVIGLL